MEGRHQLHPNPSSYQPPVFMPWCVGASREERLPPNNLRRVKRAQSLTSLTHERPADADEFAADTVMGQLVPDRNSSGNSVVRSRNSSTHANIWQSIQAVAVLSVEAEE